MFNFAYNIIVILSEDGERPTFEKKTHIFVVQCQIISNLM